MNNVNIIGRIARDMELFQSTNGTVYTRFVVAVDRRSANGQKQADFISCTAFGATAQNLCKFKAKGDLIAVCGSIASSTWTDQNGQKHYSISVRAENVQYLDSRNQRQASVQPAYCQQ